MQGHATALLCPVGGARPHNSLSLGGARACNGTDMSLDGVRAHNSLSLAGRGCAVDGHAVHGTQRCLGRCTARNPTAFGDARPHTRCGFALRRPLTPDFCLFASRFCHPIRASWVRRLSPRPCLSGRLHALAHADLESARRRTRSSSPRVLTTTTPARMHRRNAFSALLALD